jgi:hypothetical protein
MWAVNICEWGGPSTSVVIPIGGEWCCHCPSLWGPWVRLGSLLRPGGSFEGGVLAIGVLHSCSVEVGQWVQDGEERAQDQWHDFHQSCT